MGKDVIVACDFASAEQTFAFLDKFTGRKPFVKIGMELYYAEGPSIFKEIKALGHEFLEDGWTEAKPAGCTEKGLMEKEGDPEIKEISAEEKEKGYLFALENQTIAESLKGYFELLRLQAKSYVLMGDGGTPRDLNGKYIVKAKMYEDVIKLYLPYETEGAEMAEGPLYKDVPYLYTVTDVESCKKALKVIGESMISIGMTKYPRNASKLKGAGDEETAFGYKIRFN